MKYFFLLLVILFFLVTRLFAFPDNPPTLYWDEASIGYNAYSIITTGMDEWGTRFPVNFRAFGEFKLPVYIYTVAAFETILGLNAWSVRLPAVLYSLGTVIIVYFLSKKLGLSQISSFFASFILSSSPWFFIISRVGYESTAGLMFYLLGIYLILLNKNKFLILGTLSFVFSLYSYNSFRVIVPLTVLVLFVYGILNSKSYLKQNLRYILLSFLVLAMGSLPIIKAYLIGDVSRRISQISIFSSSNDPLDTFNIFLSNFFSHLSPEFLFINGDLNLRSHYVGFGELFWLTLLLLILGIIYLFKSSKKYFLLSFVFLFIFILPAAITTEAPHSLRTLSLVVLISIISGFGVEYIILNFKSQRYILGVLFVIYLGLFSHFFYNFLTNYPKLSSDQWQYSYNKFFQDNKENFNKYSSVYVTDSYTQPYIFALYNLRISPDEFRKTVEYNSVDRWGVSTVAKFGKFNFINKLIDYPQNSLIASPILLKIDNLSLVSDVKDLSGSTKLFIYESK